LIKISDLNQMIFLQKNHEFDLNHEFD